MPLSIELTAHYLGSLVYLAAFGSIVGFGTYLTLLGRIGAAKAGYTMVMFPVVAILISLGVGESELSWDIGIGIALVLTANVLVLRSRGTSATAANRLPGTSGACGGYVLQKPD